MKYLGQTIFCLLAFLSLSVLQAADSGYNEKEGEFVRVMDNDDGSRTIFKRIPGQRQMLKRTYDPNGTLIAFSLYINDIYGELRSCKIYDGKRNELFKVAYGYDKFGRLVEEHMFESKTNELVSVFRYTYGADGKRSSPVCVVKKPGAMAKDRFKFAAPSAYEKDPFSEPEKTKMRGKDLKK